MNKRVYVVNKPEHGMLSDLCIGIQGLFYPWVDLILYIKATVVVSVYLCGQCLEDSSSHCPFPVELLQM